VTDVDRLGLEQEFVKILGVDVPTSIFPCGQARFGAVGEVAAFQTKLKSAGYTRPRNSMTGSFEDGGGRSFSSIRIEWRSRPASVNYNRKTE
jgi:hypothetical protein